MQKRVKSPLGLVLGASLALPAMAADYDLVILNGRVMDPETMLDAQLNVGVKDGKIAIITKDAISGDETIDATGHVVAPGFIDTHFHSLDGLSIKMAARDGVTTGMDLEIGAINVDEWYAAKKDKWPLNYGTTISQEGVRMLVHDPEANIKGPQDATTILGSLQNEVAADGVPGWSVTRSTVEQMNKITALLDEGLRQGAPRPATAVSRRSTAAITATPRSRRRRLGSTRCMPMPPCFAPHCSISTITTTAGGRSRRSCSWRGPRE